MKQILVTETDGSKKTVNLSLFKYIQLRLSKCVFYEYRRKEGWNGALPFFLSYCDKHGFYLARPHGFNALIDCQQCRNEIFKTLYQSKINPR